MPLTALNRRDHHRQVYFRFFNEQGLMRILVPISKINPRCGYFRNFFSGSLGSYERKNRFEKSCSDTNKIMVG